MEQRRRRKSFLAAGLALMLACGIAGTTLLFTQPDVHAKADGADEWSGDLSIWGQTSLPAAPSGYDDKGGEPKQIEISSAEGLAYFSRAVYLDTEHNLDGAVVTLTTDIDLKDQLWIPIGQTNRATGPAIRFSGTFDGGGNTIYNLNSDPFFDSIVKEDSNYFIKVSDSIKVPFGLKGGTEYCYGLFSVATGITVKNLNVVGVHIAFDQTGVKSGLQVDRAGALIGYSEGEVNLENCTVGSKGTVNEIISDIAGGTLGGLVGGIYAYGKDTGGNTSTSSTYFQNITFTNCINYVNISEGEKVVTKEGKYGGMLGYVGNSKHCLTFENCINYGNISGGEYIGGITSYYYVVAGRNSTDRLINCDNYGNIVSKAAIRAGGISNITNWQAATFKVTDCNNYGNVGGKICVGGILGDCFNDNPSASIDMLNNFNYGDIYFYGTGSETTNNGESVASAGGYIGNLFYDGTNSYSGGSVGTVHGTKALLTNDRIHSDIGRTKMDATTDKGFTPTFTKKYFVDAGSFKTYEDNTKVPTTPEADIDAPVRKSVAASDSTFNYADEGKSEIIGLVDGESAPATLQIPATVEKIGFSAFAGHSEITAIEFLGNNVRAIGNNVKEIGDWAFSGTGITSLELPSSLKTIGNGAFGGISTLNNVTLPANANSISLGKGVFDSTRSGDGAFLIATGSAQYWQLSSNNGYSQSGGVLTYVVTIDYVYDGAKVSGASETRLHGQTYKVALQAEVWAERELTFSGPSKYPDAQWFENADRTNMVGEEYLNRLLISDIENITLYAYSASDGTRHFMPRTGVIYDKNKTYTVNELNMLLYPSSDTIDLDAMEVTIQYNGATTDRIHDAGEYTVEVKEDQKTYTFTVTIEKATLNLADLANLEWQLDGANTELISATLYIYTKDGADYPSLQILDNKQLEALGIDDSSYRVSIVNYSVVRNRGTNKIVIIGDGFTAKYNNDSDFTNVSSEIGSYKAKATLTATQNYVFTVGNINALRGMTIDLNENGTATVTKEWYVIDLGNSIVFRDTYDHTYGDVNFVATAPSLQYEDINNPNYLEEISMRLTLNGSTIGSAFGVADFADFINSSMPAGEYRLTITIPAVTAKDPTDDVEIYLNGYTETFTFTVAKATLPSITAVEDAFTGEEFKLEDGDNTVYNATAKAVIDSYTGQYANLARVGEWAKSEYDNLYSNFVIRFNLAGSNDVYTETIPVSAMGEYTVYYEIFALNYISSIEGVSRYGYKFTLIKYHVVSVPDISENNKDLTYTGSAVLPTIDESEYFEVIWGDMDEYISAGTHFVTLKLLNSKLTRWAGHETDGEAEVKVDFEIKRASNKFTVQPNMLGWAYHDRSEANFIRALALFGELHFSVIKEGETTAVSTVLNDFKINVADGSVSAAVESALNELKGGTYILKVWVDGTDDYAGLDTGDTIKFNITKLQNSWKYGNEDLSLPSWIVGRYDPEESPLVVNATAGTVHFRIADMDENVYYDSTDPEYGDMSAILNSLKVGKYLLTAWVDGDVDYSELAPRTFILEVFQKPGLPWWATLIVAVGSLSVAALIIFILWKKGVFRIITDKILIAIRTRVSVESTIASVRAAKMAEEGKKSVADAKRRERLEKLRQRQQELRELPADERAAILEAKAKADEERAERLRARSESTLAKAAKMRGDEAKPAEEAPVDHEVQPAEETPVSEATTQSETAVNAEESATPETPTEE